MQPRYALHFALRRENWCWNTPTPLEVNDSLIRTHVRRKAPSGRQPKTGIVNSWSPRSRGAVPHATVVRISVHSHIGFLNKIKHSHQFRNGIHIQFGNRHTAVFLDGLNADPENPGDL